MASQSDKIVIDGNQLMHRVTLGFRMPRVLGFRMRLAGKVFELGGWISGLDIVVFFDDDEPCDIRSPS